MGGRFKDVSRGVPKTNDVGGWRASVLATSKADRAGVDTQKRNLCRASRTSGVPRTRQKIGRATSSRVAGSPSRCSKSSNSRYEKENSLLGRKMRSEGYCQIRARTGAALKRPENNNNKKKTRAAPCRVVQTIYNVRGRVHVCTKTDWLGELRGRSTERAIKHHLRRAHSGEGWLASFDIADGIWVRPIGHHRGKHPPTHARSHAHTQ